MALRVRGKYAISITALLLAGCNFSLFDKSDNILTSYKLGKSKIIEVHSIGYGATTKDLTIVGIKDGPRERLDTLKKIEGNFSNYKTDIIRINDTMFQVRFTDTSYYRSNAKCFSFNIKERSIKL